MVAQIIIAAIGSLLFIGGMIAGMARGGIGALQAIIGGLAIFVLCEIWSELYLIRRHAQQKTTPDR